MGVKVVIAEKPSVAREIARVLGCKSKSEGYMSGEGYVVTWAFGHLIGQKEPDDIDEKYKKWRSQDLPILPEEIPLKILRGKKAQFDIIKKLINSKDTDSLVCATDAGREGELIFRWIYGYAKCTKPFERLWISSLTDEAIRRGFGELKPSSGFDGLFRSAESRAWADWVVGMNATRAYTLRYDALLSIGRVQTPTLAFLVKRAKEIEAFVPDDYWTITAEFGDYSGDWRDPKTLDVKCLTEAEAKAISSRCKGKRGIVTDAKRERKSKKPPLLYDLTELQRDCNRRFGFTSKKTLEIAQSLYEKHKVITYPRTDSRYLTPDVAAKLGDTLKRVRIPALSGDIERVLASGKLNITDRIVNEKKVSDHHAMIPTGASKNFESLSEDEQKVYDRIARRLVAALMPDFEFTDMTIVTRVNDTDDFLSRGSHTEIEGWRSLYLGESKNEDRSLPAVSVGDERTAQKLSVKKKRTTPPPFYTEAMLLSSMEHAGRELEDEELRESMKDSGLGTPATRAAIIERVIATGCAERRGKTIRATEKGIKLIGVLPEKMCSATLTGNWEKMLADMASGAGERDEFRSEIRGFTKYIINESTSSSAKCEFEREERRSKKKYPPRESLGVCPVCGKGTIHENSKAFFCSGWKEGCKFTWWKNCLARSGGPEITPKLAKLILEKKSVRGSTGTIVLKSDGTLGFGR